MKRLHLADESTLAVGIFLLLHLHMPPSAITPTRVY